MGFTTPAFIRKNTPELRKKLEKLGYNHSTDVIEDERFCIATSPVNCNYRVILKEVFDDTNPHITVAQGSWSIENGGEYKISLYTPTIVIKDKKMFNTRFVKDVAYKIMEALNDEFGEDNWNTCNEEQKCWLPMSRNSFYLQIPNFEKY